MPLLLRLLASRAGSTLNASGLATETGIPYTSLKRYLSLLETIFLLRLVNTWSHDRSRILTKAPKAYLVDTENPSAKPRLIDIFDYADPAEVGTVAEQRAFQTKWIKAQTGEFG